MTYKTEDGELITGSSPLEVLTNLKNGSRFDAEKELDSYLTDFLERTGEYYGETCNLVDHGEILIYLIRIGYLTEVK